MRAVFSLFARTLIILGLLGFTGSAMARSRSAKKKAAPPKLSFSKASARKSLINPHEQINDEGEILWSKCLICHAKMPDTENLHSSVNMEIRFNNNYNKVCYICHVVHKHPGSEGIGPQMSGFVAPSHLREFSRKLYLNMRLEKKEVPVLIPLDPASGKIICSTCHNPHERGLLYGRADWGADQSVLLRSEGLDVCQYCHRK